MVRYERMSLTNVEAKVFWQDESWTFLKSAAEFVFVIQFQNSSLESHFSSSRRDLTFSRSCLKDDLIHYLYIMNQDIE